MAKLQWHSNIFFPGDVLAYTRQGCTRNPFEQLQWQTVKCILGHYFPLPFKTNWKAPPLGVEIELKKQKDFLVRWANTQFKSCFIRHGPHNGIQLKHSESAAEIELLCYYHNATITFGKRAVSPVQTLRSHCKAQAY